MKTLVFIHGWGLGPDLWDEVRARLRHPSRALDLGYYGPRDLERPPGRVVVVGHSLGFQLALGHGDFDAWVSVSGFPRFVGGEGLPEGVAPRVLERMRRRFRQTPEQVLTDFLARCGTTPPPGRAPEVTRLSEGLAALAELDLRDALEQARPRLVLAGTDDPIVPPDMARALWGDEVRWVEGGGHLLPRTHPGEVADALTRFVEALP